MYHDDSDPIADRHRGYIESVTAGNVELVTGIFRDDAVLMPPNETTVYGLPAIQEWHQDYFRNFKITSLVESEREVRVLDEWALERWAYEVSIDSLNDGETIHDHGRFLKNWTRDPDGVWRIVYAMFNSIQPVGSGTSRFLSSIRKA